MKSETITGLRLYYEQEEYEAAQLIGKACKKSVDLIQSRWGLETPAGCRVYVMTSWPRFLFHSAPWLWKGYLILTFPLVARRAQAVWPSAGGWALQYGRRKVVGIKPPRLLQTANRKLGEQFFIQDRDNEEKVQTITCHELVHAFTSHLRLPAWLHEGIATLAMEHYLGRRMVREDTLEHITCLDGSDSPAKLKKLSVDRPQALIALYVQGYWLARYIEETRPELLRAILAKRRGLKDLEHMLASAYGKDSQKFWSEITAYMQAYFRTPSMG